MMAVFKDENEVYAFLGGIFQRGLEKEGLADKLANSGVVLRVHYTDPDAVVTVDMANKVVETGADSTAVPNVELFMSADTGNKFWLGKVNLTMAMAKGTVRAKGPVPKLIKLIPQAKNLFPEYRSMLQSQNRQDLIDA
jgi:putative sterol carrier protein